MEVSEMASPLLSPEVSPPLLCSSAHRGARTGRAGPAPAAGLQGGTAHKCYVHRELRDGASHSWAEGPVNAVTLGVSEGRTSEGDQTPELAVPRDPIPGRGEPRQSSLLAGQADPAGRDHGRRPPQGAQERSRAAEKAALQAERRQLDTVPPL